VDRKPAFPEHDAAGVDLSLLRSILRLTPYERLQRMERAARDTKALNEFGRRHAERQRDDPPRS
jgi:hypothetical protein